MNFMKTVAVVVALTVLGGGSALAAEGMKCCCEKMAAKMECCDKGAAKPSDQKGGADHSAHGASAAETPADQHKH